MSLEEQSQGDGEGLIFDHVRQKEELHNSRVVKLRIVEEGNVF